MIRVVIALLMVCATGVAWAQTLVIANVTVIDGTGRDPKPHQWVQVIDGRIKRIIGGPVQGEPVIDGTGKFLIPGLIDVHVHVRGGGGWGEKPAPNVEQGMAGLRDYITRGITTIFDAGNSPDFIYGLRARERAGEIVSPRLFTTGQMAGTSQFRGSAPDTTAPWDEVQARLDRLLSLKPDLLKFSFERFGKVPGEIVAAVPNEMMQRAVRYVRGKGVRTTIHITDERIAAIVVGAGMTTLEHPVVTAPISDEFASTLVRKKIPFATTLSVFDDLKTMMWPEWTAPMRSVAMTNVRKLSEMGGVAVIGSDNWDPAMTLREIDVVGEAGIEPLKVIRIATLNGAHFLNREREFGSIEAGKRADMVLLDGDPVADLTNLRRVAAVFKDGRKIE